jgi:hypothetical protein
MFYKLSHPKYESDEIQDKNNPIDVVEKKWMPGIICPSCGTWASSRRKYRTILDLRIFNYTNKPPLPVQDWKKMESQAREYIEIKNNEHLFPGEIIGTPWVQIKNEIKNDFLFAWSGEVIISESVYLILSSANLTGFSFKEINIKNKANNYNLYAIFPEQICLMKDIKKCTICNRPKMTDEYAFESKKIMNTLSLDIFSPEINPNIIYISDRCRDIILLNKFSNIDLIPINI